MSRAVNSFRLFRPFLTLPALRKFGLALARPAFPRLGSGKKCSELTERTNRTGHKRSAREILTLVLLLLAGFSVPLRQVVW